MLDVDSPSRPGLRVEVASGGRMLLRQDARPVLLARVAAYHRGVDYARLAGYRSPVAPCRAARARAAAGFGPAEGAARWARSFAADLAASWTGPLHAGRWVLARDDRAARPAGTPDYWSHHASADSGYVGWDCFLPGRRAVLPLRALSPPDAARVKAYRKQARDGTLPPVLTWFIGGLDSDVLLDGHDRLAAALAEGQEPAALSLTLLGDERTQEQARNHALSQYARDMALAENLIASGRRLPQTGYLQANRSLGRALRDIGSWPGRTRAWLLTGGAAAWQQEAEALPANLTWTSDPADPA